MLVDCDDITHTKKIEYFLNIKPNMSIFLHNYVFKNDTLDIYNEYNINENDILLCNYTKFNNVLYNESATNIHNGYPIVKAEIYYELNIIKT
jgi:hypothetical protein